MKPMIRSFDRQLVKDMILKQVHTHLKDDIRPSFDTLFWRMRRSFYDHITLRNIPQIEIQLEQDLRDGKIE